MIHTANHDLTRTHQGWGAPDLARLYDTRNATSFVDATHELDNLDVVENVLLPVGTAAPARRATAW